MGGPRPNHRQRRIEQLLLDLMPDGVSPEPEPRPEPWVEVHGDNNIVIVIIEKADVPDRCSPEDTR
jgi:hypothetical protein